MLQNLNMDYGFHQYQKIYLSHFKKFYLTDLSESILVGQESVEGVGGHLGESVVGGGEHGERSRARQSINKTYGRIFFKKKKGKKRDGFRQKERQPGKKNTKP